MADKLMEEVDQLLAEREKYSGWLERLESERSAVSSRAYQRVHEDYTNRLNEVDRRLEEHTEAIGSRVDELEGELETLESQRSERADDLEEARLRHSVGEYRDEKEWKTLEGRLTSAVEKVERKLRDVREEIERLQGVLGQVRSDAEAVAADGAGARSAADGHAEDRGGAGADRMGEGSAAAGAQPSKKAAASAVESDEAVGPDELEGFGEDAELPIEEFGAGVNGAADPGQAAGDAAEGTGEEGEELEDELAFLESLSLDNSEEMDSLMFLEEKGRGEPQTVICPQCSAANGPAEWYCTECGEELPAE